MDIPALVLTGAGMTGGYNVVNFLIHHFDFHPCFLVFHIIMF